MATGTRKIRTINEHVELNVENDPVDELISRTGHRQASFKIIKDHLMKIDKPLIVETGCVRSDNDFGGAGSSTLIWDAYVEKYGGSYVSIDITPHYVGFAKSLVKHPNSIICSESVRCLKTMSEMHEYCIGKVDVLYLDSLDLEEGMEHQSAMHHVFELMAATEMLYFGSLVMIDDNPSHDNGKGKYVLEYMQKIGNPLIHDGYQLIWRWQ